MATVRTRPRPTAPVIVLLLACLCLLLAAPESHAQDPGHRNTPELIESMLDSNGIKMHVYQQGAGPMVLFLHGFPELGYSWRKQLDALSGEGYLAVAPDMRGFGSTDSPADVEAYDALDLCGDVVGLIDAFGREKAVLVGHDWGAAVAWYCALLEPDRFVGLVTMSVPWGARSSRSPLDRIRAGAGENFNYFLYFQEPRVAEAELNGRVREFFTKLFVSPGAPREAAVITSPLASAGGWVDRLGLPKNPPDWIDQEDLDFFVSEYERTGFDGGLNYYRNVERSWSLTPQLSGRTIPVPTLFLAGDREFLIAGRGKENLDQAMRQVAPTLRIEIIPGQIGHWLQQQAPDQVNSHLLEFLKQLDAGPVGDGW